MWCHGFLSLRPEKIYMLCERILYQVFSICGMFLLVLVFLWYLFIFLSRTQFNWFVTTGRSFAVS